MEVKLQLKGLDELEKELKYLQTHAVKIGVLGLTAGGAKEMKYNIALIKEYAIYNEYGTTVSRGKNKGRRHILPRPFFRLSVATSKAQKEITDFMRDEIEQVVSGEITGEQYLKNLGTFVVKKIREKIKTYPFIPNNPHTTKRKNQSNTLMDTHSLYNSISYEIVEV